MIFLHILHKTNMFHFSNVNATIEKGVLEVYYLSPLDKKAGTMRYELNILQY